MIEAQRAAAAEQKRQAAAEERRQRDAIESALLASLRLSACSVEFHMGDHLSGEGHGERCSNS
jgi:hypothetical protein